MKNIKSDPYQNSEQYRTSKINDGVLTQQNITEQYKRMGQPFIYCIEISLGWFFKWINEDRTMHVQGQTMKFTNSS